MSLLEVEGITKTFGALRAVFDVSLAVQPGERLGLLGPNGSGKTTAFNLISGVLRPDRGCVRFAGTDITGWSTHRCARLGLVRTFQQASVFPGLTVADSISIALEMTRRSREGWHFRHVGEVLAVCGLEPVATVVGMNLSYGNARLTNLAVALAVQPELLLLDEPAAGLNDDESGLLADSLRRVNAAGTSLVVIDHDMGFISGLCERAVVLAAGVVIANGTFEEISADQQVKDVYLGEPVEVRGG